MHRKVRPTLRQACNKEQMGCLAPPFSSMRLEAIAREAGSCSGQTKSGLTSFCFPLQ